MKYPTTPLVKLGMLSILKISFFSNQEYLVILPALLLSVIFLFLVLLVLILNLEEIKELDSHIGKDFFIYFAEGDPSSFKEAIDSSKSSF